MSSATPAPVQPLSNPSSSHQLSPIAKPVLNPQPTPEATLGLQIHSVWCMGCVVHSLDECKTGNDIGSEFCVCSLTLQWSGPNMGSTWHYNYYTFTLRICVEVDNEVCSVVPSTAAYASYSRCQCKLKMCPRSIITISADIHDHFDVMDEVHDIATRWKQFGAALRIPVPVLDRIETDRRDAKSCLSEVVTEWLNHSYKTERFGLPSWKMLADAVGHRSGGNNNALARKIANKYNG